MKALGPLRARHRLIAGGAAALLVGVCIATAFALQWQTERRAIEVAETVTGGEVRRAPSIVRRFGCGGCHTIPGIRGADGQVAPPLAGLRQRVFIAGVARNTPEQLVRWIVAPQSVVPGTAMPMTGISEQQARDVAAYLYSR